MKKGGFFKSLVVGKIFIAGLSPTLEDDSHEMLLKFCRENRSELVFFLWEEHTTSGVVVMPLFELLKKHRITFEKKTHNICAIVCTSFFFISDSQQRLKTLFLSNQFKLLARVNFKAFQEITKKTASARFKGRFPYSFVLPLSRSLNLSFFLALSLSFAFNFTLFLFLLFAFKAFSRWE